MVEIKKFLKKMLIIKKLENLQKFSLTVNELKGNIKNQKLSHKRGKNHPIEVKF